MVSQADRGRFRRAARRSCAGWPTRKSRTRPHARRTSSPRATTRARARKRPRRSLGAAGAPAGRRGCPSSISASATCSAWRRSPPGCTWASSSTAAGTAAASAPGSAEALGWRVGEAKVLAPIALVAGGGALLARPAWPALRPLRAGALCLAAGITMALAAGTLGVSSWASPRSGESSWSSAFMQSHGGVVGESLYQLSHRLVQNVGRRHPDPVLLRGGDTAHRRLARPRPARRAAALGRLGGSCGQMLTARLAGTTPITSAPRRWPHTSRTGACRLSPPSPAPEELMVRATHVEAPSQDADGHRRRRRPDRPPSSRTRRIRGGRRPRRRPRPSPPRRRAEEEAIPGIAHADPQELTPQGRYREASPKIPSSSGRCPTPANC